MSLMMPGAARRLAFDPCLITEERVRARRIEGLHELPAFVRPPSEIEMTLILPRDVLNRFEQRWSARVAQAESFHAKAEHLKRTNPAVPEGASLPIEPPPRQSDKPKGRSDAKTALS